MSSFMLSDHQVYPFVAIFEADKLKFGARRVPQ